MVTFHGIFTVKPGLRNEYIEAIRKSNLVEAFRKQNGCIFYEVSTAVLEPDDVIISDAWETEAAFKGHVESQAVAEWHEIYHRYVISSIEHEYHFEPGKA